MRNGRANSAGVAEVLTVARQVAAIVRRVTGDPGYHAILYGSWATGDARERSDIDIGILGPKPVDPGAMLEIRDACEALPTLYTIELVDLAKLPEAFKREAVARSMELEPA